MDSDGLAIVMTVLQDPGLNILILNFSVFVTPVISIYVNFRLKRISPIVYIT